MSATIGEKLPYSFSNVRQKSERVSKLFLTPSLTNKYYKYCQVYYIYCRLTIIGKILRTIIAIEKDILNNIHFYGVYFLKPVFLWYKVNKLDPLW